MSSVNAPLVPSGTQRSRSILTLFVAVVAAALIGGCNTTTTAAPPPSRIGTTGLGNPTPQLIAGLGPIVCTSQQSCEAVGSSVKGQSTFAIAATTSDGGAHWAGISLPVRIDSVYGVGLSCPSARSCVVVGGTLVGNDLFGKLVRTSDGGQTRAKSVPPGGTGGIKDVACPTKMFCMAVGATPDGSGGVALVTTNSGVTWTRLLLPTGEKSLSHVACGSPSMCAAVGGGPSGSGATVIMTNNRGKSWAEASLPQGTTSLTGPDISSGISCPSATSCFIVGSEAPGDGNPAGLIFATSNGGKSWTPQPLPPGTSGLLGISCGTPATCVVVGGGIGPRGGPGVGKILTTTNAGGSWTPRSVPAAVGGLDGVSCSTFAQCVATGLSPSGAEPIVATTSDGGVTWSSFTL